VVIVRGIGMKRWLVSWDVVRVARANAFDSGYFALCDGEKND